MIGIAEPAGRTVLCWCWQCASLGGRLRSVRTAAGRGLPALPSLPADDWCFTGDEIERLILVMGKANANRKQIYERDKTNRGKGSAAEEG